MTPSPERFGKAVLGVLGSGPSASSLAAQRARILQAAANEAPARSRVWPWLALAAATALLALAVGLGRNGAADGRLEARWQNRAVESRTALEVGREPARTLEFSDGSTVTLHAETRAELSELAPGRTALRLDRGKVGVAVERATGATWTIAAGPFAVRVVGTRFSVQLATAPERLIVDVAEGRVVVSGGDLPPGGVTLDPGQRLERPLLPPQPPSRTSASTPAVPAPVVAARSPRTPAAPDWRSLAKQGKYGEALQAAEAAGFEALQSQLPESDVLMLANTARYAGSAERARQALLKLRQRFPGRPAAVLAAFYLARLAQDRANDPRQAASWLRTYLRESPSGDLAAGARVDLMDILLRSGDRAGARAVARDYLAHHPNGSHAAQARTLLAQP